MDWDKGHLYSEYIYTLRIAPISRSKGKAYFYVAHPVLIPMPGDGIELP